MNETGQRSVIWLDDELASDYEFALTPWSRALEHRVGQLGAKLLRCQSLEKFVETVQQCTQSGSVALLVIDVMLNFEANKTFEPLGFANERLIPLEAGARIAGLIRSSLFDHARPPWLTALRSTPMLILSASPRAPDWVTREVGPSRMDDVEVVLKDLTPQSDGQAMEPVQAFFEVLNRLLLSKRLAAAP